MTLEAIVMGGAGLFVVGMLVAISRQFWRFLGWFIQPARGGEVMLRRPASVCVQVVACVAPTPSKDGLLARGAPLPLMTQPPRHAAAAREI